MRADSCFIKKRAESGNTESLIDSRVLMQAHVPGPDPANSEMINNSTE